MSDLLATAFRDGHGLGRPTTARLTETRLQRSKGRVANPKGLPNIITQSNRSTSSAANSMIVVAMLKTEAYNLWDKSVLARRQKSEPDWRNTQDARATRSYPKMSSTSFSILLARTETVEAAACHAIAHAKAGVAARPRRSSDRSPRRAGHFA